MPLVACVKAVRMWRLESKVDRAAADYNRQLDYQEEAANRAQVQHYLEDLDRASAVLRKLQEHLMEQSLDHNAVNMALIWIENAYNDIQQLVD